MFVWNVDVHVSCCQPLPHQGDAVLQPTYGERVCHLGLLINGQRSPSWRRLEEVARIMMGGLGMFDIQFEFICHSPEKIWKFLVVPLPFHTMDWT